MGSSISRISVIDDLRVAKVNNAVIFIRNQILLLGLNTLVNYTIIII